MQSDFHAGLAVWDYLVVALYGLWMLGIGAFFARRQTNLGEYFLGGRSMNPVIVGISTMATLVSTITYLTTPGEIIKNGFGVLWGMVSIVPAFFLVGYLIIPRIMERQVVSGYQLLEKQFGIGIRRAAAGLFVLTRVAWVGLVVYTCSVALSAMTGWRLEPVLIATGLITTVYTVIGGIRAVMITDVVQAFILFAGAVGVVIFAMWHAGSPTGWWPRLSAPEVKAGLNWPHVPWFALHMSVRISVFGMILHQLTWWVLTASSDQLAIQRYLSTRDARAARKSFLVNGIANTLVGTFLALVGIALLGFFLSPSQAVPPLAELLPKNAARQPVAMTAGASAVPALQQKAFVLAQGADKLFPWFIAHVLPAGLSGLLLAALFSAAMSSVSSGINSITTILMVDFGHVFCRQVEETARVAAAKRTGLVIGILTTGVSFLLQYVKGNFMDVAQKVNLFFVAPLGALFIMAFFVRGTNKNGAWASVAAGFAVGVVMAYYGEIYAHITGIEIRSTFTYTLAAALAAGLIVGFLVSRAFPVRNRSREN